jgi:hypothetical protein
VLFEQRDLRTVGERGALEWRQPDAARCVLVGSGRAGEQHQAQCGRAHETPPHCLAPTAGAAPALAWDFAACNNPTVRLCFCSTVAASLRTSSAVMLS